MECAGRALSLWAYQATQDICYQEYLYKTLSEKYSTLSMRLDKTVNDANTEIDSLHRTISGKLWPGNKRKNLMALTLLCSQVCCQNRRP